jgi:hypothetical protein
MIEMGMTIQEEFYIGQFEAELGDIVLDLWSGLHEAAIEEKMAFRRRDQIGADFVGSDVVEISNDPEWVDRFVPTSLLLICLGEEVIDEEEKTR